MSFEVTESSTVHGLGTPYGVNTPHKFPERPNIDLSEVFADLALQLYPTGRAFQFKKNGVWDNLHNAINKSMITLVEDSYLTIDSLFPDNVNFTINDAELWEYRLGLISNNDLTLEVRKQAIFRKMAYPGNAKARQHPSFIQDQLQKAGFDVYVHENTPPYKTPGDILLTVLNASQYGGDSQYGGSFQYGSGSYSVIANSSATNEEYAVGGNIWASFFIGGEVLGETAQVPQTRLTEFKELVLKLKPAHTVAYTFITYV